MADQPWTQALTGRPEPVAFAAFVAALVSLLTLLLSWEPALSAAVLVVAQTGAALWARSKVTPTDG